MLQELDSDLSNQSFENLSTADLAEQAVIRREGNLASNGAIVVETGHRTGRSPKDRFIVQEASTSDAIDWGDINQPIDPSVFDHLWDKIYRWLSGTIAILDFVNSGRVL